MAHQVVWLPAAPQDLTAIEQYIAAQSPTYAGNVVRRVLAAAEDLELFPRTGRVVPEVEELGLRELIVYQYRLIYKVYDREVRIGAVIHGARLLPAALGQRTF